ncbi:FimV/HubP family polar landmark protein [Aliivibrio sp. 1S128]|uniref:FimV/HubP family polar landmark protein n=1 Tax=Aliivibrio sp. 1S128 TaxID=1840085 RepID=UPI00080EC047|nr:FimV/HubP family polar landmark protein [Aliivibrio sp. 1S128]OCH16400.1 hypothetical protein A6E03_13225 [Aliivibrio sp. 1S128]
MSDVSNKLLKTLTPLALFVASQCSVANAAGTIQIVGPEGKDQTVSSQVVAQSQPARTVTTAVVQERKVSPAKIYGPTKENETLWSIASDINPSNTTSVQQTLLAIYRLNPHAFENNNIHGLEPNSRLRLPTLEQVRRENTDDAKQLLLAHKKKLATQSTSTSKAVEKTPVQVKKETPTSLNKVKPDIVEAKSEKALSKAATPTDVGALKSELETTEQEFSALQENNHQLRVRLAEVQNEVDNLKNSLGDEDRIRNEVEKFINEQKQLAAAEKKTEPSAMDNLASSPGLIALLALIPGALIAGLIGFFLFRRKKEEDESSAENTNTEQPSALIMPDDHFNLDDDIPEISLDDDDDILADLNDDEFLFGNDDSDLNDDLFAEFETENKELDDEDPFALLDGEDNDDLNSMLSDKELDDLDAIDMSSSALTVDSEEKALGLEEMEKALNDFDSDLFSTSDLEEEDDDFDLSLIDDSELSALDKPAPELDDNEDLEGGELDQSMLDDLFSSMDMEDDSELDQGWDLDEKEETKLAPESASKSVEDELDFDTLLSGIEDNKDVEESDKEESIDLDVDEDNVTLLDELLDESDDEDSFDLDIKDDSTALLDDLLDDDAEIDLDIDDDSTALLDELLSDDEELIEDDDDIEIDEDSTALLDEFLLDKDEDDTPELDEDSTVLLDELLGDDFEEEEKTLGKSGDDTEVEGVAVSDLLSEDTPRDEDWLVEADDDEDDDIPLFESESESESEAKDEPATEEDDSLFDIDELLDSEIAQEETSPELDELELLEATSLETPEQIDVQDADENEALEEAVVEAEGSEVKDEPTTEEDDSLFDIDELLNSETEEEKDPLEHTKDDENDFLLDDFLEDSAVDFSKENTEDDLQSDETEDNNFDGLSIEDALAALEDDSEVANEIATETSLDEDSLTKLDVDETSTPDPVDFQSRVSDEEKEALTYLDSSGLDLDSMLDDGGSDWSGFNLDNATNTESELEDEDWSEQPSVESDPHGADRFLSIEALIAESENGDKSEFEEEEFNLDVGLNEFPDMLNNRELHDVDVNNDVQSKLDLARAYIEMSDKKGALELLKDVLHCDDVALRAEAEKLMKQID